MDDCGVYRPKVANFALLIDSPFSERRAGAAESASEQRVVDGAAECREGYGRKREEKKGQEQKGEHDDSRDRRHCARLSLSLVGE